MSNHRALFVFGTLLDTDLLQLVSSQAIDSLTLEPAVLVNYECRNVLNQHYPLLVAVEGAQAAGKVIRGLTTEALDRIVFYEGVHYALYPSEVVLNNGMTEAVAYFAGSEQVVPLKTHWNLAQWQANAKSDTLPRAERYMQCYGEMSVAEAEAYW